MSDNASQSNVDSIPVPLLDVNRGNSPLLDEIKEAISGVCDSGRFLYGPDVQQLEQTVAELSGTKHAIGCASGSDALLLALMALEIGPGDQVIAPSFTFFATASAIWRLGAETVFVDIDPETYNLCPEEVAKAITPKTKAIIPVHLFGQCADMDAINELAKKHDLKVVEDAAQAIGASLNGEAAGSLGDMGCFSFYPTKNLGGFGDGGMLTTNCDVLADRLRKLSAHGMRPRYFHSEVGINSRLDTIQAAVLNVKIKHLSNWADARRTNADRYTDAFSDSGVSNLIETPNTVTGDGHVWNQYTVRVQNGLRDSLRSYLADRNIGSEIYYPVPLHQQECFQSLGYETGSLPETERAAAEVLSLPIFPELMAEEHDRVVEAVREFAKEGSKSAAA